MRVCMLLLLFVVYVAGQRALDWTDINCPSNDNCVYTNQEQVDVLVTTFFQADKNVGEVLSMKCTMDQADRATVCSRSWTAAEAGASGLCFFFLPAGQSFRCDINGGAIHVIESHMTKLNGTVIDGQSGQRMSSCEGQSKCTATNSDTTDWWVMLGLKSTDANKNTFTCSYSGKEVCNFASVNGTGDESSCTFLVPHGQELQCSSQGNIQITSAYRTKTKMAITSGTEVPPSQVTCPNTTVPTTTSPTCDCAWQNQHVDRDVVVYMSTRSAMKDYTAMHCGIWGANVCGWSSPFYPLLDTGAACYFILPAGAAYECSMQYGYPDFPKAIITDLVTSIFPDPKFQQKGTTNPKTTTRALSGPQNNNGRTQFELKKLFQQWMQENDKSYADADLPQRFTNFKAHVALVDGQRRDHTQSHFNNLADLSRDEFEQTYKGCGRVGAPRTPVAFNLSISDAPANVDWRTKGAVTPVKNQGQCGSCWSFSTTGVIESAWFLAGHPLVGLSEQTLVSCEKDCDGCNGGWPYKAVDWVVKNGIDTEASYPYTSGQGSVAPCEQQSHTKADVQVKGHMTLPQNEDQIAAYVAKYGPVSISIFAMTDLWWPYTGGIMKGCCANQADHAILIAGYGETTDGEKYWLVKNSWGSSWGENGYIRLARGVNECGITQAVVSALVEGGPKPPPSPPSTYCAPQATLTKTGADTYSCLWKNGTNGLVMPPTLQSNCYYFDQGDFGYSWDMSLGGFDKYPCPAAADENWQGHTLSCDIQSGYRGALIAPNATKDCDKMTQGVFGYHWTQPANQ